MAADDGPRAGSGKRPEVRDPDLPPAQPAGVAYRPLVPAMRVLLYVAAVLVLLAGFQLFVFTGRTNTYFAWTIVNPLAAAFLGAAYWASVAIEALAAKRWMRWVMAPPSL